MANDLDFERAIYSHQQGAHTAPPSGGLFDTYADQVLRRLDNVLADREVAWQADAQQKAMLRQLRHHVGRAKAIPLTDFSERMHIDARKVKELVQSLRVEFGVQIGALRNSGGGYYLISSDEESLESYDYLFSQALSMLRTAHAMRPKHTVAELAGQISLELEKEPAHVRS